MFEPQATAGLRKLEINDPAGSEAVHTAIRQTLASSTFRFESDWARTITGDEEGIYGWVARNYQSGTLDEATELAYSNAKWEDNRLKPDDARVHELLTVGTLDLGGSSLEVRIKPI